MRIRAFQCPAKTTQLAFLFSSLPFQNCSTPPSSLVLACFGQLQNWKLQRGGRMRITSRGALVWRDDPHRCPQLFHTRSHERVKKVNSNP